MEISALACKGGHACPPEVRTYASPAVSGEGRLPPEFCFEAALKIGPVAQTVLKFCQNFTSAADIEGELGTLPKRCDLLQFGDSVTGMTSSGSGHRTDRAGD